MKILLIVHQFFPDYSSGTEVLTYSVARELRRQGHQVAVFTGFPAAEQLKEIDRFDQYALDGMQVFRFHHAFAPMGGQDSLAEIEYCNFLATQYFEQLIKDFNPDIIHFFHLSRLGAGLMDVAFAAEISSYYTPTDFWSICLTTQLVLENGKICAGPTRHGGNCVKHAAQLTRYGLAKRIIGIVPEKMIEGVARLTAENVLPPYPFSRDIAAVSRRKDFIVKRLNRLSKIVAPTQLMMDMLIAHGVHEASIIKSAYGIDTSFYDAYPRTDTGGGVLTIGFIGTFSNHKGCHVLLEAINSLKDENIRVKIYGRSFGDPEYYARLRELASGDDRVEFCGTFPNEEIGRILSEIDLLVVPSLWYENTPLVIYSALASGCPVVASDFPGMSEVVVNADNGLLFEPGKVEELRKKLLLLSRERDVLARLRGNCRKPKSTHQYVDELLALYQVAGKSDTTSSPKMMNDPMQRLTVGEIN